MAEQRLPIVNADDGQWGIIIRQYLMKEHFNDDTNNAANGGHQNVTIRPGTATLAPLTLTSGTNLTTPVSGAMEYDGSFFTLTQGGTRKKIAIYDDSSGASGDLYYRDSAGAFKRLPAGTAGQQLTMSGGLPTWSGSTSLTTSTKTASYTIGATDAVIFVNAGSGAVTITLPAASGLPGYRFYVKRIDGSYPTNAVTIARSGTDLIDGQASFTLDLQYTAFIIVSDGSAAWYIL